MMIKRVKPDGWPRLSTLGDGISKEAYRALQAGGVEDVDESVAGILLKIGVCEAVQGGEGE